MTLCFGGGTETQRTSGSAHHTGRRRVNMDPHQSLETAQVETPPRPLPFLDGNIFLGLVTHQPGFHVGKETSGVMRWKFLCEQ